MDFLSLFNSSLALYGLLALILLAVVMGWLMKKQRLSRENRIIFLIMFVLVAGWILLALFAR